MLKRDKNYRISKLTKVMMAFAKSPTQRSNIKNLMISADIVGSSLVTKKDKKKQVANIEVSEE